MLYLSDHNQPAVVSLTAVPPPRLAARVKPDLKTGPLHQPFGLAVSPAGPILVADSGNHRIVVLNAKRAASRVADSNTSAVGAMQGPRGVALAKRGQLVVADTDNHRILFSRFNLTQLVKETADLRAWSAFGTPGSRANSGTGTFLAPVSVWVDASGRILVADAGLDRLVRFDNRGGDGWVELAMPPGNSKPRPYGLAPGPGDAVLVTDLVNARVIQVDSAGEATVLIDGLADRSIVAPVAAVMHGSNIVVADAAAAQLTEWQFDAGSGQWQLRGHLLGVPGATGGPSFPELCGLASTGGTP